MTNERWGDPQPLEFTEEFAVEWLKTNNEECPNCTTIESDMYLADVEIDVYNSAPAIIRLMNCWTCHSTWRTLYKILEGNVEKCIHCGSNSIIRHGGHFEKDIYTEEMLCRSCDGIWYNTYKSVKLIGINQLRFIEDLDK